MSEIQGFLAYSNEPKSLEETLEAALIKLNNTHVFDIKSWKNMNVTGKIIINEICHEISNRDIFICDLTTMNYNVLFELGYAIGKNRRIFILLDKNILSAKKQFDTLGLLKTIGYISYSNSTDIMNSLLKSNFEEKNESLIETIVKSMNSYDDVPYVFYLKSLVETEASIKLARTVSDQKIKITLDDPAETSNRTLPWYIESLYKSNGIIAHLLSDIHEDKILHNAKSSLICGIAYALDLPVLMLAHNPFVSPIDYKDIIEVHETAAQCQNFAEDWFDNYHDKLNEVKTYERYTRDELKAQNDLQKLNIGDIVAENEVNLLTEYFVRTTYFEEALRSNHTIFIGRKGCGKTANLINLNNELDNNHNHVCIIKPVAYEIEGVLDVLRKDLSRAERGYLVESLWKFLIYTELAKSVYRKLKERPAHYQFISDEINIIEYVEKNTNIIMSEFSVRLDYAVEQLKQKELNISLTEQKQRISELLHNNIINRLRNVLGYYLNKKAKVVILVDNLDKAWNINTNIELMSEFIFGLLDVGDSILKDFSHEDHWRQPANLSLIIFLRDDIFNQISRYAPEKDKLPIKKIIWEDPEVLLRVIEERMYSDQVNINVWSKYFNKTVKGQNSKSYLCDYTIPRPRDMVYLVKESLSNAINRKHLKIDEKDIIDAQRTYSQFALNTLVTESGSQIPKLEDFLFEFAGSNEIIYQDEIISFMENCNFDISKFNEIIQCLCNLSFLGIETDENCFTFIYNEEDFSRYKVMSKKLVKSSKKVRYKIHKAFHSYLEIKV